MMYNWFNKLLIKGVCKLYGWILHLNKEQVTLMVESITMMRNIKLQSEVKDGKDTN